MEIVIRSTLWIGSFFYTQLYMKKIPSLFIQTPDHVLTREINPDCQWVINGEGFPTAKYDGSACAVINGKLYKRYDNSQRKGNDRIMKTTPCDDWIHCGCTTYRGKFIYWIPVTSKDYYHQIAWAWAQGALEEGTYELIGPEVQGNPHKFDKNTLIKHSRTHLRFPNPRTYDEIYDYLKNKCEFEGIVWHHTDGRMCKITKKKFGIEWE